jgi:hypothetical protein
MIAITSYQRPESQREKREERREKREEIRD